MSVKSLDGIIPTPNDSLAHYIRWRENIRAQLIVHMGKRITVQFL